jgi:hypothetical protein
VSSTRTFDTEAYKARYRAAFESYDGYQVPKLLWLDVEACRACTSLREAESALYREYRDLTHSGGDDPQLHDDYTALYGVHDRHQQRAHPDYWQAEQRESEERAAHMKACGL